VFTADSITGRKKGSVNLRMSLDSTQAYQKGRKEERLKGMKKAYETYWIPPLS
jgi:hypothetical protein